MYESIQHVDKFLPLVLFVISLADGNGMILVQIILLQLC